MLRLSARLAVTALAASALAVGLVAAPAYAVAPDTTVTSGPAGDHILPGPVTFTFTSDPGGAWVVRNVPCEQAGAAYAVAQGRFFHWQNKLARAKRQLHRAHAHGTAAQFQHAKNEVKRIKTKIHKYKDAMNAAIALEAAVC